MNARYRDEAPDPSLARWVMTGMTAAVVLAAVVIGAGTRDGSGVVAEATAAPPTAAAGYRDDYFPSQFPSPEGPPEPHIEAF
jgi:hypothetical protein